MAPAGDDHDLDEADIDRLMTLAAELVDFDFERIDPPTDLWDRIEAGVAAEQEPRTPPARTVSAGPIVEYTIDADDVIVAVGEQWADFAAENHAPELAAPPRDRTLWSYFDRDEVRELWQLLVERIRSTGSSTVVPLRCDAPQARRWFEMTVTPSDDGTVRFRSLLVFEESRPPVALLDPDAARAVDEPPVPLCSWCGRARHGDTWLTVESLVRERRLLEQADVPLISYGICGGCRDEMAADLLVDHTTDEGPT